MYLAHVQDDVRHYRTPNQKGMTAVAVSSARLSVSSVFSDRTDKGNGCAGSVWFASECVSTSQKPDEH